MTTFTSSSAYDWGIVGHNGASQSVTATFGNDGNTVDVTVGGTPLSTLALNTGDPALTLANLVGSYQSTNADGDTTTSTIDSNGNYSGSITFGDGSGTCHYTGTVAINTDMPSIFNINFSWANEAACDTYQDMSANGIGSIDGDGNLVYVAQNVTTQTTDGEYPETEAFETPQ